MCGNSLFVENSAERFGGGMMFFLCDFNITGQASFFRNTAIKAGSAVYINTSNGNIGGKVNIFNGFSRYSFHEGSLTIRNSILHLTGMLVLENNRGGQGGAIHAKDSELNFWGCIQCFNNLAYSNGGALLARSSTINIRNNSSCSIFQNNVAVRRGGALFAMDSTINLSGSQKFLNNSARQGGAIGIDSSSKLVLSQPLQASFIENNAFVGGAVFYEDIFSANQCAESNPNELRVNNCFIELDSTSNITLNSLNNSAESAGTTVEIELVGTTVMSQLLRSMKFHTVLLLIT